MNGSAADPDLIAPFRGSSWQFVDALPGAAVVAAGAFMAVASIAIAAGLFRRWRAGEPILPTVASPAVTWDGPTVAIVAAVAIGCQFAGLVAAEAIDGAAVGGGREHGLTATDLASVAVATLVACVVATAIVLLAGGTRRALGLFSDEPAEDLRLAVGTVLLITPPLLLMSAALNWIVPYEHPILDLLARSRDPFTLAAVGLSAVVAAPIGEELFFRGVLQGWFASLVARENHDGHRRHAAVAASALCFAAAHYGHGLGWIPLIGFGLAVGLLRSARGSLLPCVAVHAIFNAISIAIVLLA